MVKPNTSNPAIRRSCSADRRWVMVAGLIGVAFAFACLLVTGGDDELICQGRPYRAYLPELAMPGASSNYLEAKRVVYEAGVQGLPTLRAIILRGEPRHVRYFLRWQTKFPPRLRSWLLQRIKPYDYQQELQGAFSAVELLGKVAAPVAGELGALFGERDFAGQSQLARALSRLGPAAVEPILPFLSAPDLRTRSLAAFVIHELGPQATNAIGPLVEGLQGADANHQRLVAQTLGRMGSSVLPRVTPLLASADSETRLVAVRALGYLLPRSQELTPRLVLLLDDPVPEVRLEMAILLMTWWRVPVAEWRRHLAGLPPEHPTRDRLDASLDSVELSRPRTIEVLREGLTAATPDARRRAAMLLVEMGCVDAAVVSCLDELSTTAGNPPWEMAGLTTVLNRARQQMLAAGLNGPPETLPRPGTAPAAQSPPSADPRPPDKSP